MSAPNLQTGKVKVESHSTYEQAMTAAYAEAANTAGWSFPVVVFQQASRMLLSGAFPIGFVESRLFSRSAAIGQAASKARDSMNRPEMVPHVNNIAKYLSENAGGKYIIPPLTLNVQKQVTLHSIDTESTYKAGYLVIPSGVNLSITDGQHRVKGIVKALIGLAETNHPAVESLRLDSISVMITCEHDLKQIHQDFADCSKTKALPPSLLSLYDTRNPGNRIVFDLEAQCRLFNGRIDSTSRSLSKKSPYLFLANQLRQMVKHILLRGNPSDAVFENRVSHLICNDEQYQNYSKNIIDYVEELTETIPVFKKIADLPLNSPQKQQIAQYRQDGWICLTATGLNILGCLGHDLFTLGVPDWRDYVRKLADIDWQRNGSIWKDTIIRHDGKIMTQTTPVKNATEDLEKAISFNRDALQWKHKSTECENQN